MFKSIMTLMKGRTHERVESLTDRHAISILRQQIRESANSVASARKAVAIAIAQNQQECAQYQKLVSRIDDLEERTIAAMEQGKDALAREAAETIALLQVERDTSQKAQERFNAEIDRLKKAVRLSEARLRDLQRGHRLADATDKTQKMRQTVPDNGASTLQDAERTLERLQSRQKEIDATAAAMEEMDLSNDPATITEKLAEAGCGEKLTSSADDVLTRLSKQLSKKETKPINDKKSKKTEAWKTANNI